MSWLYLPALVEESLGTSSLGGEQSAQLKSTSTAKKPSSNGSAMEYSNRSRSGMTCDLLTDARGVESWISSLADSRARISALPARATESTESEADFGASSRESLAKYDRDLRLWKTRQHSLLGDYIEYAETWPRWGMTRGGGLYRLETPSGLEAIRQCITDAKESGSSVKMPTPTVCGNYNRKGASKESGDGLATAVARTMRVATPIARDWRSGKASEATHAKNSRPLSEQIGGSLNPNWVEWLMGWPIGWTELRPLGMGKFRQWLGSHGSC